MTRAAIFLLRASEHARYASQRTRRMLEAAVALFNAQVLIERARHG